MTDTLEEIQMLRIKAESSLSKNAELQQVLAQIEATISRKENQKITEKSE